MQIDRSCLTEAAEQPWWELLLELHELPNSNDFSKVMEANTKLVKTMPEDGDFLENHPLLALAALAFQDNDQSAGMNLLSLTFFLMFDLIELEEPLMKIVSQYPALHAAYVERDVGSDMQQSVYHLMNSIICVKDGGLFAWQATNTVTADRDTDLPHCSGELATKYVLCRIAQNLSVAQACFVREPQLSILPPRRPTDSGVLYVHV